MRVGFIIYGSLGGMSGGYLYDRKLVEYLRDCGDSVEVISLPWRSYAAHLTDNLHFRLPHHLDVVIEDELNHPSLLAANAGPHPYPVVSIVHNLHSSEPRARAANTLYRAIERIYLNDIDGFIFNSKTTRAAAEACLAEPKPHLVATPGGDRLGRLTADVVFRRAEEAGPLRILFLASVIPLKGLHVLLEAISSQPSAFELEVVGSMSADPQYGRRMQRMAEQNNLSDRVRFHGILDGEVLIEKLKGAQVMVIPSSYEGFGIALLEGMAFGLPAIATRGGAIPELITDGENGFLIAQGDARKLAGRLEQLSADRALLTRLSLSALDRFQVQPTWGQMCRQIRVFLDEMIQRF